MVKENDTNAFTIMINYDVDDDKRSSNSCLNLSSYCRFMKNFDQSLFSEDGILLQDIHLSSYPLQCFLLFRHIQMFIYVQFIFFLPGKNLQRYCILSDEVHR